MQCWLYCFWETCQRARLTVYLFVRSFIHSCLVCFLFCPCHFSLSHFSILSFLSFFPFRGSTGEGGISLGFSFYVVKKIVLLQLSRLRLNYQKTKHIPVSPLEKATAQTKTIHPAQSFSQKIRYVNSSCMRCVFHFTLVLLRSRRAGSVVKRLLDAVSWLLNVPATRKECFSGADMLRLLNMLPRWGKTIANQTRYLTQSHYTDTGPTSPSTDQNARRSGG